jgi:hypothetical protein
VDAKVGFARQKFKNGPNGEKYRGKHWVFFARKCAREGLFVGNI